MMAGWNRPTRRRSGDGGRMSNASSSSNLAVTPEVPRKPHPPNKKQHEADLQDIQDKITAKEQEMVAINRQFETDVAATADRRAEISAKIQAAHDRLRIASDNLRLRQDELAKKDMEINTARAKLTYRNEAVIDSTINRLEHERSTKHFSLPEEQKIINEINRLRRSKNELRKFNALRNEKEIMENSLSGLRKTRADALQEKHNVQAEDRMYREREEKHQMHLNELFGGMRSLNKQRSRLVKEHNQRTVEWEEHLTATRRQKQQHFELQLRSRPADLPYDSTPRDPLAGLKQIVNNLLAYIHTLAKQDDANGPATTTQSLDNPPTQDALAVPVNRPSTPPPASSSSLFEETPGYFLPKKYSDSMVTQKIVGRGKKEKKKHKPITHNATVVAQFMKLDISLPATFADLPDTLEKLKAKKLLLDQQAQVGSDSATPKASPSEEFASPMPAMGTEDEMSPAEEARILPRMDRLPSITLSGDGNESVVLLDNFAALKLAANHDDPITLSHLEEVNAGGSGDPNQDMLRSDDTASTAASTISMAEPMDHVTDSESILDDGEQRSDSGIGRYAGLNPFDHHRGSDTPDGSTLRSYIRSESISEEEPSEETAENSGEETHDNPSVLSNSSCDKKIESPPISPDTMRLNVNNNGNGRVPAMLVGGGDCERPKESAIDTQGVYPETPPIDDLLSKRPIFPSRSIAE
ncbi:uncharacterized protein LOC129581023 [Paramacrobiotus metropolitanus]|uniref:uncharacterized protein LOC129581023 n=1 Tax=Paramacrobiotus metropolitanus TaxID=2943436 RepID=UPI0024458C50|nr:uncharacterized protein LOC129581023 [Paramacrobiotus metropolitanus]XP_055327825.1 uncharacterized protein LOC129581023 [Paramacrobiotus metropolitanus]